MTGSVQGVEFVFNMFDSIINPTKQYLNVNILFLSISLEILLTLITLRSNSKLFRKKVPVYLNHINILTLIRISLY